MEVDDASPKKKAQRGRTESAGDVKPQPAKKIHKLEEDDDEDEDFVAPSSRKGSVDATPNKKLKSSSGKGVAWKLDESNDDEGESTKSNSKSIGRGSRRGSKGSSATPTAAKGMDADEGDEEDVDDKESVKPAGRGRGGRGAPAGGRGRGGGGRGGFMNFGERKDPPHKGEKVSETWRIPVSFL